MSFHFAFVARSVEDARAKLAQQHAPAAVKAVIESALDTMPVPHTTLAQQSTLGGAGAPKSAGADAKVGPSWQTGFFGVSIEASGHVGSGYASVTKLEVRPLVA